MSATEDSELDCLFFENNWLWHYHSPEMPTDDLKLIYEITSAREFWQLYNNIRSPSELSLREKYAIYNADNTISETSPRYHTIQTIFYKPLDIDIIWEELLLGIMGQEIDKYNHVSMIMIENNRDFYNIMLHIIPDNYEEFIRSYSSHLLAHAGDLNYTSHIFY